MEKIFQQILQMSIYGSVAIAAVFILRKCFRKLPKRITCLFWLIPLVRLLCPLNFKTGLSLMNIAKLSDDADKTVNKVANAVIPAAAARPEISQIHRTVGMETARTLTASGPDLKKIAAYIWLVGMLMILMYLGIKTVRMLKLLKTAHKVPNRDYYVSDAFDTSFVLGIVRPRIYMQSGLPEREKAYVLAHERTHIKYLDHITKIVGVLTVCLHWFNPFVWLAFVKMCADLEMRCDETVIDRMGDNIKRDYCRSIVKHAMQHDTAERGLYAAFAGDNYSGKEIKMRITNIISYKKISKIAAAFVIVFSLGITAVLSARAQSKDGEDSKASAEVSKEAVTITPAAVAEAEDFVKGAPVSVPGNILTEMTEEENLANYGKEEFELPADVEYSDEGRPYSKTYDYRSTPVLNKIGAILERDGYEILDPDMEYLDKEGNIRIGRELYCLNAWKEEGEETMLMNIYMVSEEYARDSYNEIKVKDGIWYAEDEDHTEGDWYNYRLYDPATGVMIDATASFEWDWEAMELF